MTRRRRKRLGGKGVGRDHQSRTCLLVKDGVEVEFIPLDISEGLQLHTTTQASFEVRYKMLPNYPLDKAASLYLNYALAIGASDAVIDHLSKIVEVSDEDREKINHANQARLKRHQR